MYKPLATRPTISPLERLRSLAREHSETALNVIIGIMNAEAIAPDTRLRAAAMLLDRAVGKPTELVEMPDMQVARRIVREIVHVKETREEIDNHDLVVSYDEIKTNGNGRDH